MLFCLNGKPVARIAPFKSLIGLIRRRALFNCAPEPRWAVNSSLRIDRKHTQLQFYRAYAQQLKQRSEGNLYKVIRAIQWVNDPLNISIFTFDRTAFFTNDAVIRVRLLDGIDNQLFCFFVDVCDKVVLTFWVDSILSVFSNDFAIWLPAIRAARIAIFSIGCI